MTNTNTKNNKHYKKYKQLLNKSFVLRIESECLLSQAAKELALSIGFSEESKLFSAIFVTGGETIVTYNEIGNMSDLDLSVMETMTKQQIMGKLYKYEKD